MSDEHGLLAACRADPDDDTPRIVYADWLNENNREIQAEFIRKQIRLGECVKAEAGAKGQVSHDTLRLWDELAEELEMPGIRGRLVLDILGQTFPAVLDYGKLEVLPRAYATIQFGLGRARASIGSIVVTGTQRRKSHIPDIFAAIIKRGMIDAVVTTLDYYSRYSSGLFSTAPIRSVILADRLPLAEDLDDPVRSRGRGDVQWTLWGALPRQQIVNGAIPYPILGAGVRVVSFDAFAPALDFLSRRLVHYGRLCARQPALHDNELALSLFRNPSFASVQYAEQEDRPDDEDTRDDPNA